MSGLRGQSAFWLQPGGSQESDKWRLRFAPKPFMMEPSEHQVNAEVYSRILTAATSCRLPQSGHVTFLWRVLSAFFRNCRWVSFTSFYPGLFFYMSAALSAVSRLLAR